MVELPKYTQTCNQQQTHELVLVCIETQQIRCDNIVNDSQAKEILTMLDTVNERIVEVKKGVKTS
jgi:hypothetical protein